MCSKIYQNQNPDAEFSSKILMNLVKNFWLRQEVESWCYQPLDEIPISNVEKNSDVEIGILM
jgi:hypothetical protein